MVDRLLKTNELKKKSALNIDVSNNCDRATKAVGGSFT